MTTVGTRIKRQRQAMKMSLRGLAEVVGISCSYLHEIEHGDGTPGAEVMYRFALAFGCTIEDLLGHKPLPCRVSGGTSPLAAENLRLKRQIAAIRRAVEIA